MVRVYKLSGLTGCETSFRLFPELFRLFSGRSGENSGRNFRPDRTLGPSYSMYFQVAQYVSLFTETGAETFAYNFHMKKQARSIAFLRCEMSQL